MPRLRRCEWVTTQVWPVPNGNFVWKNAFNHFLRYSALAEEDFSGGRFIAQVAVFDQSANRQLAFREAGFRVRLPQLPNGPPPGIPSAPAPMHDCGTSNDLGCTMTREGQYPMDAQVFGGIIQAARPAQRNDAPANHTGAARCALSHRAATEPDARHVSQ